VIALAIGSQLSSLKSLPRAFLTSLLPNHSKATTSTHFIYFHRQRVDFITKTPLTFLQHINNMTGRKYYSLSHLDVVVHALLSPSPLLHVHKEVGDSLIDVTHLDACSTHASTTSLLLHFVAIIANILSLQAEKVVKVSERVEPSVTARFFVTTSRVLPSQLSDVLRVVEVSSVSQP
jgi:hypothetical protein